jgi:hypothetical protein
MKSLFFTTLITLLNLTIFSQPNNILSDKVVEIGEHTEDKYYFKTAEYLDSDGKEMYRLNVEIGPSGMAYDKNMNFVFKNFVIKIHWQDWRPDSRQLPRSETDKRQQFSFDLPNPVQLKEVITKGVAPFTNIYEDRFFTVYIHLVDLTPSTTIDFYESVKIQVIIERND